MMNWRIPRLRLFRTSASRQPLGTSRLGLLLACGVLSLTGGGVFAAEAAGQTPAGPQREFSPLQAALVMERVLVEAIENAEASVVAVARVANNDESLPPQPLFEHFGNFPGTNPAKPKPTDPDFVPNEYATGVVVDPSGLILTNYHVLGDTNCKFFVTTNERKVYEATIRAADPRSDLAVLELQGENIQLQPIKLGDADSLKKGNFVIALGNPYAIARDGQPSASWGIVSNSRRKLPQIPDASTREAKPTLHHYGTLIQTDLRLDLGCSGGPLLNLKGEMVGLTTSLAALAGYEQPGGFAIPVDDTFRMVVQKLKREQEVEFGFLGIAPQNLDPDEIRNGAQGIRIYSVEPGTPAAAAGLMRNDVITAVNGEPIFDADHLVLSIGKLPVGEQVRLTLKGGRQARVELAKYPVLGKQIFDPGPSWRGMHVDYVTATNSNRLGPLPGLDACVAVVRVSQDSLAWKSGLRPGMLISHVETEPVKTPKEFKTAVESRTGEVRLVVVGEGPLVVPEASS